MQFGGWIVDSIVCSRCAWLKWKDVLGHGGVEQWAVSNSTNLVGLRLFWCIVVVAFSHNYFRR